jgi:transcriptional regulator NrdR family protein
VNCPRCRSPSKVLYKDHGGRRRQCLNDACRNRFTTVEVLKADHERTQELLEDARDLASRLSA